MVNHSLADSLADPRMNRKSRKRSRGRGRGSLSGCFRAFSFFQGRLRLRAGATISAITAKPQAADHDANCFTIAAMRVLLQRVSRGSVTVGAEVVGAIDRGYVLLLGVGRGDTEAAAEKLAEKIVHLRLFANDAGKFDRSLLEVGGGALVVSQFTLYGNTAKGRRPSFDQAAPPELAKPLYECFAAKLRALGVSRVETGRFGASMAVQLCNDGPVTLWLEG